MECVFQLSSATGRSVRKPHQLILGMASSTKRLNGFFFSAAILWNTLPAKIQKITNPRLFRATLEDRWTRQKYNPPLEPEPLSDTFQNFGHSLSLSPSPLPPPTPSLSPPSLSQVFFLPNILCVHVRKLRTSVRKSTTKTDLQNLPNQFRSEQTGKLGVPLRFLSRTAQPPQKK